MEVVTVFPSQGTCLGKPAFTEAYKTMLANYEALITTFNQRGLPVITGGDWNQSVRS